jgi:hypothetical protein
MKKEKIRMLSSILFLCMFLPLLSDGQKKNNETSLVRWYKGNTHTHTLASDGNAPASYVVEWYHNQGYHFLSLTDHNKVILPDTVQLPVHVRKDFILIQAEEVSGGRSIHTTGLNLDGYVDPGDKNLTSTEILQNHIHSVIANSGLPILNHPNFSRGIHAIDISATKKLGLMELFNGHPGVYNWGKDGHAPVEVKWDSLLTMGHRIFAVASDDAHHYDEFYPEKANPGRGWVMVRSTLLTADSVVAAMERGDFYASNGVILKTVDSNPDTITVEIDLAATKEQLRSPYLTGNITGSGVPGFSIEFIGAGGKTLQKSGGTSARYAINGNEQYIRCRVSYCRKRAENKFEYLYAWTQPVFLL